MKKLHICLDSSENCLTTYMDTVKAIQREEEEIYTTQLDFFSLTYLLRDGYYLYVHYNDCVYIVDDSLYVYGYGTVRPSQNIHAMLLANCFPWFINE